jgi:hypothetical protein
MGKRVLTLDRGRLKERDVEKDSGRRLVREAPFLPLG